MIMNKDISKIVQLPLEGGAVLQEKQVWERHRF